MFEPNNKPKWLYDALDVIGDLVHDVGDVNQTDEERELAEIEVIQLIRDKLMDSYVNGKEAERNKPETTYERNSNGTLTIKPPRNIPRPSHGRVYEEEAV